MTMNIYLFSGCLLLILALAYIGSNVNWSKELEDMFNLFKVGKEKEV